MGCYIVGAVVGIAACLGLLTYLTRDLFQWRSW